MPRTDFRTHDDYIATFPPGVQDVLQAVRRAIRRGAPKAVEVISYQAPAFRTDDGWVLYYHAHKQHFSLACPPPSSVWDAFAEDLAGLPISKSTVRFPFDRPVPSRLITAMAKHRVQEVAEAAAAKRGGVTAMSARKVTARKQGPRGT